MNGSEPGSDAVQWAEARRWFAKADEDIRAAGALLVLAPPAVDSAAFHCQQAAEKILKGLLIAARKKAGKTHDLAGLATAVSEAFPSIRDDLDPFPPLTPWFVATRYPDIDIEPRPTASEVSAALQRLQALRGKVDALDPRGRTGSQGG